jgi:3-deoxy-manno-octulosonate cytidylyltransferase (CMP-KDO synthetase)
LPAKVLELIQGRPMVQWVHEKALASKAGEVWVATDHEKIASTVAGFGGRALMTSSAHASGSDRIAEIASRLEWGPEDIVVNLQGDEPMMPPELIDQVAAILHARPSAQISTLSAPIRSMQELLDPNVVKVCVDAQGAALYFSRAPIPWPRESPPDRADSTADAYRFARRHVGLYAYRCGALVRLASVPQTPLEGLERLEQLRALESGIDIHVAEACRASGQDVNTAADLELIREVLPGPAH